MAMLTAIHTFYILFFNIVVEIQDSISCIFLLFT